MEAIGSNNTGDYELKRNEQDLEIAKRVLAIQALDAINDAYLAEDED